MRSVSRLAAIPITILLTVSIAASTLRQAKTAPSGINLDASGFTTFTPSADTRKIYVSSSTGNDNNDGLTPQTAVATLAKGESLIRNGSADWLLLKAGDTWVNQNLPLSFHGRSASEPIVISSYGTGARPVIETNANAFGFAVGNNVNNQNGDYVAIDGLNFYAYTRDPSNPNFSAAGLQQQQAGFYFLNKFDWLLMENCVFNYYDGNAIQYPNAATGGMSNQVILRRNIIENSYNSNGAHSQGLYVDSVANLVLQGNLFDHNGWNASVAGANPTLFNHDLYIQYTSGPATLIDNIFSNASSHGAQVRNGGVVTDNLFVHDPIGLQIWGSASTVSGNVVTESNDIDSSNPRGYGIVVGAPESGMLQTGPITVQNNIITHEASAFTNGIGIYLAGAKGVSATNNIIYQWDSSIVDKGVGNITSHNAINLRDYPDPNRTVETYNASLGGRPTLSDFLEEARKQSKENWRPQYTASAVNEYIRAGFGIQPSDRPTAGVVPK